MSYNGRFGLDFYAADSAAGGRWRWFGTSANAATHNFESTSLYPDAPVDESPRAYTVHFPTHIAVDIMSIGVLSGSTIEPYRC